MPSTGAWHAVSIQHGVVYAVKGSEPRMCRGLLVEVKSD